MRTRLAGLNGAGPQDGVAHIASSMSPKILAPVFIVPSSKSDVPLIAKSSHDVK